MSSRDASQILQESFLEVRAKLLEIAATLDRIETADGIEAIPANDPHRAKIDQAIDILASDGTDRAARLQHLFSRPYEADWRKTMEL